LAFLVLLIIATAIMLAWLVLSVTRFALGDLRLPGLHTSPAQPVIPPAREAGVEAPTIVAAPQATAADGESDAEVDTESAVREHLYGREFRRR
jgi:hypothetical protein